MKFYLKRLGTLSSAELNLGKFTVICGNNNTSKTILCNAIYGYYKHMRSTAAFFSANFLPPNFESLTSFDIDIDALVPMLKEQIAEAEIQYKKVLHREFDVDISLVKDTYINIDFESITPNYNDEYSYSIGAGTITAERGEGSSIIKFSILPKAKAAENVDIKGLTANLLCHACFFTMFPNPAVMTSERSGIAIFQKELDSSKDNIVDGLKGNEDKKVLKNISRYATSIRDNISTVRDASQLSKGRSFLPHDLLDTFCSIIGGKYLVNNQDLVFETAGTEKNKKISLPIHHSSSSVKALFLLYIYIASTATPNDILIIDEPELSLHPDNQRKLLRLLVRICNHGVRIFITTHSDFFIKELNTLIMLAELPKAKQEIQLKSISYDENEIISKENIRAYFITEDEITVPTVDKFGIDIETFNREIDAMNFAYDSIANELYNE